MNGEPSRTIHEPWFTEQIKPIKIMFKYRVEAIHVFGENVVCELSNCLGKYGGIATNQGTSRFFVADCDKWVVGQMVSVRLTPAIPAKWSVKSNQSNQMKSLLYFLASVALLISPAVILRLCDMIPQQYQLVAAGIVGGFVIGGTFIGGLYCAVFDKWS
jgi:hypothetical protein